MKVAKYQVKEFDIRITIAKRILTLSPRTSEITFEDIHESNNNLTVLEIKCFVIFLYTHTVFLP